MLRDAGGVQGQRVFVRADLNAPIRDGAVSDDTRLRASLPTVRRLRDAGARVVLASHLGRPKGQRKPEFSLRPVAERLAELLGAPVGFADDCVGAGAERAAASLSDGDVLLLENLRFHPGEEANDPDFARALARVADVYVNDAFGTAHRAHASTVGIVACARRAVAGDLLRSELAHLSVVLDPKRPLLCLLGGAKVSDKLAVLEALAARADALAIGGAMAYTFLRAQGEPTGASRVEADRVEDARRVLALTQSSKLRILLPKDHVVAERAEAGAPTRVVERIPDGWVGVDIGPETAAAYAHAAREAGTVFWNGPMGIFEIEAFAHGTEAMARALADAPGVSVVGGGDSIAAVNRLGLGDHITHLSTGGGASLEYVQGRVLPGVAALEQPA
ncbi:MAG: phosphoglycerate kinase [Deltaproteobacteria bacterium]|nr:MAG: phosphoglycerate kinase [Deltaproteobacteria bacterium]